MLAKLLSIPSLFQWQQRACNNYKNVKTEFSDFLQASLLNILDIGCSTGVCGQEGFDMRVASIKKDTKEKNSFGRVRRGSAGLIKLAEELDGGAAVCSDPRSGLRSLRRLM